VPVLLVCIVKLGTVNVLSWHLCIVSVWSQGW